MLIPTIKIHKGQLALGIAFGFIILNLLSSKTARKQNTAKPAKHDDYAFVSVWLSGCLHERSPKYTVRLFDHTNGFALNFWLIQATYTDVNLCLDIAITEQSTNYVECETYIRNEDDTINLGLFSVNRDYDMLSNIIAKLSQLLVVEKFDVEVTQNLVRNQINAKA